MPPYGHHSTPEECSVEDDPKEAAINIHWEGIHSVYLCQHFNSFLNSGMSRSQHSNTAGSSAQESTHSLVSYGSAPPQFKNSFSHLKHLVSIWFHLAAPKDHFKQGNTLLLIVPLVTSSNPIPL